MPVNAKDILEQFKASKQTDNTSQSILEQFKESKKKSGGGTDLKDSLPKQSPIPSPSNPPLQSLEEKKPDFSFNPNTAFETTVDVKTPQGAVIPIEKAKIPSIYHPETYIAELQGKINDGTITPQEQQILSTSSTKSPHAVTAYLQGDNSTGAAVDRVDYINKNKQELTNIIDGYNKKYSVNIIPDALLADPEKLSTWASDYQKELSSDAEKADLYGFYSQGAKHIPQFERDRIKQPLNDFLAIAKPQIDNHIVQSVAESNLSRDEKVRKIAQLTNPIQYANTQKVLNKPVGLDAISDKSGAFDMIGALVDEIKGTKKQDDETLNSTIGYADLALNDAYKEIANNKAAVAKLSGDEKLMQDAKNTLAQVDDSIIKKYPAVLKSQMADELAKQIATESGMLNGSDDEPKSQMGVAAKYNGITSDMVKSFVQKNGWDKDPDRKDAADWLIEHPEDVKDASIFGGIVSAAVKPFKDLGLGLLDVPNIRNSRDVITDKTNENLLPTEFNPDQTKPQFTFMGQDIHARQTLNGISGLAGMTAIAVATDGIGKIAGLGLDATELAAAGTDVAKQAQILGRAASATERASAYTSFAIPSIDPNLKASYDFIDNDAQRALFVTMGAILNGEGGNFLKLGSVAKVPGLAEDFAKVAKRLAEKDITQEAANELLKKSESKYVDYIVKFGKKGAEFGENTLKGAATMSYFGFMDKVNRMAFGDPNAKAEDLIPDAGHAFVDGILTMMPLGFVQTAGSPSKNPNSSMKGFIYDMARFPDATQDIFKLGKKSDADYNSKMQILKTAVTAKNALDAAQNENGLLLQPTQKASYVANKTVEAFLREKAAKIISTDERSVKTKDDLLSQADQLARQSVETLNGLKFTQTLEPLYDLYNAEKEYDKAFAEFQDNNSAEREAVLLEKKDVFEKLQNKYFDTKYGTVVPAIKNDKAVEPETFTLNGNSSDKGEVGNILQQGQKEADLHDINYTGTDEGVHSQLAAVGGTREGNTTISPKSRETVLNESVNDLYARLEDKAPPHYLDPLNKQGSIDELANQALTAPNDVRKQVGKDLTIELISRNTTEDINKSLDSWTEKATSETSKPAEKEDAYKHIDILEKALEEKGKIHEASKPELPIEPASSTTVSGGEAGSVGVGVEAKLEKPSAEQQLKDIEEGNMVTFEYKNESEVPEVFKDKISSKGEVNGKTYVKVTMAKSLADYHLKEQSLKEQSKAGSVGVGGDVESTTKALEEVSKTKPTLWEKIKEAVKSVGKKFGIVSNADHINNFNTAKAEWDKLSSREKKLKRADYELDDLHHTEGGYYKVGNSLIDLDLNSNHLKLLLENNKFLNILNKLGVTKIHGENRPAEEMFAHYSDGKIHLNNNSAFENIRQVTNAMSHELGHHEWTKLTKEERDYVRSLPLETGMAKHYEAQEKNGGKQTSASLQEENFADYVMQYFQGKLYGDEALLNKIPAKLREMFDNKYSDLLKDNEHLDIAEAYHKAKKDGSNPELVKAVEQSLKETTKAETPTTTKESNVVEGQGSVGVGGDVESTTKALEEVSKTKPTIWQSVKDAFNKGVNKVFGGSLKMKDSEKLSPDKIKARVELIAQKLGATIEYKPHPLGAAFNIANDGKFYITIDPKLFDKGLGNQEAFNTINVIAHELGHAIDAKEVLKNNLSDTEISELAKLHRAFINTFNFDVGEDISGLETAIKNNNKNITGDEKATKISDLRNPETNAHRHEQEELFADALRMMVISPELAKRLAPNLFERLSKHGLGDNEHQSIAEAYHDAKSKGIENDFTKAVEQSLKETTKAGSVGVGGDVGQKFDIKRGKNGFEGDFLNDYELIGEGSEHTVYRKKGSDKVIRLSEPYSDKSETTFNQRVRDAKLIDEIIGDGSLNVIGYYESENGTKNPIYEQNFQDSKPISEKEVEAHLRNIGGIEYGDKYNRGYLFNHNGKWYKINDYSDNFFKDKNGKIVAIDAAIVPISEAEINKARENDAEFNKAVEKSYNDAIKEQMIELPKEEDSVGVGGDVNAKKDDIERRRQEELKSRVVYDRFPTVEDGEFKIIGDPNNRTYRINENTGRPQELDESNGLWSNTALAPNLFMESTKRSGFEKSKSKINAKYDAELKALENKPTPSLPSNVSSGVEGSGVGGDVVDLKVIDRPSLEKKINNIGEAPNLEQIRNDDVAKQKKAHDDKIAIVDKVKDMSEKEYQQYYNETNPDNLQSHPLGLRNTKQATISQFKGDFNPTDYEYSDAQKKHGEKILDAIGSVDNVTENLTKKNQLTPEKQTALSNQRKKLEKQLNDLGIELYVPKKNTPLEVGKVKVVEADKSGSDNVVEVVRLGLIDKKTGQVIKEAEIITGEQSLPTQEVKAENEPIQNEPIKEGVEGNEPIISKTEVVKNASPVEGSGEAKAGESGGGKKPPVDTKQLFGEGEEAGKNKKEFDKMTSSIPNSGEVKKYLSGDTIKKYEKDSEGNPVELRNNQEITAQELEPALKHGLDTIEKAKEVFGDDYVNKTLDYIEAENLSPENKALLYVSLENEMAKRLQADPENVGLKKLQDLVREKSQAYLRSNSLAINMGRLRKFAETGYDITKVTDRFFSPKEKEQANTVEKLVQADAETIQKQYEQNKQKETSGFTEADIEAKVKEGVESEIAKIYESLPKEKKDKIDKDIAAIKKVKDKLKGKVYYSREAGFSEFVEKGIDKIESARKAGVNISDALDMGVEFIKEKIGDKFKEKEFRKDFLDGLKNESVLDAQQRRQAEKEYRMLETERNRQLARVADLNEKLKTLQSGERPVVNSKEYKPDVPEIEALKQKVKEETQKLNSIEAQQKRQNAKEYRMLETERNRQLARVDDLNEKLKTLQSGERPVVNSKEYKPDVPEIEALKQKVKEETQKLNSIEAQQKRVEDLEVELERLQNRQPKDKTETSKREVSEKEQELKDKIAEEKALIRKENKENNELRLSDAKEAVRRRIEKVKTEIYNKERELKESNKPINEDLELQRLKEVEKSITELRDKYLPEEKDPYDLEKQRERTKDKLVKDIIDLNDQINAGERNKKADKPNYENDAEINNLRKIRDDKKAILNEIDPLATPKEKTTAERVATAEGNLQKKIDGIRDEILKGEREVAKSKDKLRSKKLDQLREQKKALEALRDKYLPKEKDPYADKKAAKAVEDRLVKENIELNRQIAKGEKDIKEKKDSPESKNIDKLKAERDARKEILEAIDPTPKEYVRSALIEQGFGKTIKVKTKNGVEERQVLDWKKLAGAEGSVAKISENVAKSLEKNGFTPEQLERMSDAFITEYTNIRKDVIEKGLNEIAARNKTTVTPDQKSAAKKLAEMYNYGLFDKDLAEYQTVLAKTIGVDKLNPERLKEVIQLGDAMSKLMSSKFQGKQLTETELRTAVQRIEELMRSILNAEANEHGSTALKLADGAQTYMDLAQRMTLNSLKQAAENPLSGKLEDFFNTIGYAGSIPKVLNKDAAKLARQIYKEMVLEKGTGYGNVQSTFVNKGNVELIVDRMSDNQVLQGMLSTAIGKTTLDAVDSMFKSKITQQKFIYNLIQVLTKDRLIDGKIQKGMSKQDAQNYVAEKLTGQSFKEAQQTAKDIITNINESAGKKIFNDSPLFVDRLAHDIVTAALVNGQKISADMVKASYNAAYKAAGRGLGHVANNIISRQVGSVTGELESRYKEQVKDKDYRSAALTRLEAMFFRNIANPFVGGGSNWVVLKAEKSGLGLLSGVASMYKYRNSSKIDLTSEAGSKNLENAMYQQMKVRDKLIRGAVGGAATALTGLALLGIVSTDKYRKWRNKNMWAAKYADLITPEILLASMAKDNGKIQQYIENSVNKNEQMDKGVNAIKTMTSIVTGSDKAAGQAGSLIGSSIGAPVPWRLIRDGEQLWEGISGGEPYKVNSDKPETFLQGYFKAGMLDYMGYAPHPENKWFDEKDAQSPSFKILKEKGLDIPKQGTIKQYKVDINDKHPDGIMTTEEFEKFTEKKKTLLKKEIDIILNKSYEVEDKKASGKVSYKYVKGKDLDNELLKEKISDASSEITKKVKEEMKLSGHGDKKTATEL